MSLVSKELQRIVGHNGRRSLLVANRETMCDHLRYFSCLLQVLSLPKCYNEILGFIVLYLIVCLTFTIN